MLTRFFIYSEFHIFFLNLKTWEKEIITIQSNTPSNYRDWNDCCKLGLESSMANSKNSTTTTTKKEYSINLIFQDLSLKISFRRLYKYNLFAFFFNIEKKTHSHRQLVLLIKASTSSFRITLYNLIKFARKDSYTRAYEMLAKSLHR